MRYLEPVFRPPSEAESFILQITYGCSRNRCTFCGMYAEKPFRVRPLEEIKKDILEANREFPETTHVFLADGDAMILKADKLCPILDELAERFPKLERIGIYTDARGINNKSIDELCKLKEKKLRIVYLGLESGSDEVLRKIDKGATSSEMVTAVLKAQEAGIKTSVIALLGIGGKALSREHAAETAKAVSAMSPDYFSALTLTLIPGTKLFEEASHCEFEALSPEESLEELYNMIEPLEVSHRVVFRTNHASNYLSLKGVLPTDKTAILDRIRWAIENKVLRPEWMRGL